jgi:hypothetical protein
MAQASIRDAAAAARANRSDLISRPQALLPAHLIKRVTKMKHSLPVEKV